MSDWKLQTPVAFLIFNRPETTERVFAEIARAKPPKFLVVADGPRPDRPEEVEKCGATRAIIERVDWDCEILTNYSDVNLGCKRRISSGLDWVFDTVEEAIILEDDCLPHPTFFRFCAELLEKYRLDHRIMQIAGCNITHSKPASGDSYFFSKYGGIWGWATWKRAWSLYDVGMQTWPLLRDTGLIENMLQKPEQIKYWKTIFQKTYQGEIDTWDFQWILSCWLQSALAIIPSSNLIENIGFGSEATHTTGTGRCEDMTTMAMRFPMVHPTYMFPNYSADLCIGKTYFSYKIISRIKSKIKKMIELKFLKNLLSIIISIIIAPH